MNEQPIKWTMNCMPKTETPSPTSPIRENIPNDLPERAFFSSFTARNTNNTDRAQFSTNPTPNPNAVERASESTCPIKDGGNSHA